MDDIIQQYLKPKNGDRNNNEVSSQSSRNDDDDIIKQYLKPKASSPERLYVSPAPPISKPDSEAAVAAIRRNTDNKAEPDFAGLPITSVGSSTVNAFNTGRDITTGGLNDIGEGHPYKGAAKVVGGAALMGLSPLTGAVEGGIERPVTELTGNPDIGDRAGFVASSALPIKLPFVSNVANPSKVVAALPKSKAFQTLVDTIGPDNVGNVAREMRANPRLTPADLSPATLQTAQKLFVTEGDKTKNYIADYAKQSVESAKRAVENAFTGAMGSTVDPAAKLKQLTDNIKKVGATEINPVLKQTKPVDLTPVIQHIDNVLRPGVTHVISDPKTMLPYDKVQELLQRWRNQMTNDKTVLTNPDVLNKIQSGMRVTAEDLMRTGDPESKAMGYALYKLRNEVIEAIGKAGPQTVDKEGKAISAYRKGLSSYKDENDIATAFEHGHDAIIKNSRNLEDHPSFFENWVKQATEGEKEAAKEGARVAYDTQVNGFKNAARRGTDIGQSEFNHRRMEALFGKDKANEMFKKLEHERLIADRNSKLIQGSQTGMRMQADSRIALPTIKEVGHGALASAALEVPNILAHGIPGVGAATYGGLKVANTVKHAIATKLAKEHNANFAKLALPVEGPDRDALIRSLEAVANQQKPTMLSRATKAARLFGP